MTNMKIQVRWKGLSPQKKYLEPLESIFEDVSKMFERLLNQKNTSVHLSRAAWDALGLRGGKCDAEAYTQMLARATCSAKSSTWVLEKAVL